MAVALGQVLIEASRSGELYFQHFAQVDVLGYGFCWHGQGRNRGHQVWSLTTRIQGRPSTRSRSLRPTFTGGSRHGPRQSNRKKPFHDLLTGNCQYHKQGQRYESLIFGLTCPAGGSRPTSRVDPWHAIYGPSPTLNHDPFNGSGFPPRRPYIQIQHALELE